MVESLFSVLHPTLATSRYVCSSKDYLIATVSKQQWAWHMFTL